MKNKTVKLYQVTRPFGVIGPMIESVDAIEREQSFKLSKVGPVGDHCSIVKKAYNNISLSALGAAEKYLRSKEIRLRGAIRAVEIARSELDLAKALVIKAKSESRP